MTRAADFAHLASAAAIGGLSLRNKIINGNFDHWQRGTSLSTFGYLADRWKASFSNGLGTAITTTREAFTAGQTAVPGEPAYYASLALTNAGTGNGVYAVYFQPIEDVRTFAGKQITLSFWAYVGDGARKIHIEALQGFGAGGSANVTTPVGTLTTPSTPAWTKYTFTFTVPSIVGKTIGAGSALEINFWLASGSDFNSRSQSIGFQTGTFRFAQVQVEEGAVATPFEQRPIGLELALCLRYYETGSAPLESMITQSGNFGAVTIQFKARKRGTPTMSITNGARAIGSWATGIGVDGAYYGAQNVVGDRVHIASWTADAEL